MVASFCSLYESSIFGAKAVNGMDTCHICLQSVLAIVPLLGGREESLVLW